ncbi:MAG: DUF4192 domain-containing protein [Rhodococcus sp.]|nr:DUF4192 domain-containing protein [Rhodococcus sp. (in: high G+C Gram-positive bacteria)]
MTTSASSHGSTSDSSSAFGRIAHTTVRLSEPGDLIAAIPALLGFTPTRSIVAICLSGETRPTLGAVMRHDLILGEGHGLSDVMRMAVDQFATVCGRDGASGMLVVFVDDRLGSERHRSSVVDVVEYLEDAVNRQGVELIDSYLTAQIREGCEWFSLLPDGESGRQSDPVASRVALAQVLGGRVIRGSRRELEQLVEVDPTVNSVRIGALIDQAYDGSTGSRDLESERNDPHSGHRRELAFVLDEIAELASGHDPHPETSAQLALALANVTVRDCLLALAVGDRAEAAESMWMLLCRRLPDPERAGPASLLGFSAYVRGDGPLAGVALAAALDSDPDHNLARMLDVALQSGVRPTVVRELADVGFGCARTLGVQLPPPTDV